jgi:hypothetical protein
MNDFPDLRILFGFIAFRATTQDPPGLDVSFLMNRVNLGNHDSRSVTTLPYTPAAVLLTVRFLGLDKTTGSMT